ncbi:putative transcriptional regulator, TetR family [Leptospira ryugenii]|uniref:Putative transcriptional regulator, TetR family n=1 Tax=Leptospira ryugenii TaxID=1917863 RepID=A0A2P2E0J3_9LEPT|nr:TetR/AcrR family transcriptional regulator [Leptospira ryugenii]GBF50326.1 putative transcriptional regulator, TetR family [Leptospira ryugenii]
MEKKGTRFRLLETSRRLFLENGYAETGLNQIVAEANTVKASLYQHFPSKEELGREVLKLYSEENLDLLKVLMKKYPDPIDFISAWTKVIQREARQKKLYGCGMANFRAQISRSENVIKEEIESIVNKTVSSLDTYLKQAQTQGLVPKDKNTNVLARQIFMVYEGVLQCYRLTDDPKLISDLLAVSTILLKK